MLKVSLVSFRCSPSGRHSVRVPKMGYRCSFTAWRRVLRKKPTNQPAQAQGKFYSRNMNRMVGTCRIHRRLQREADFRNLKEKQKLKWLRGRKELWKKKERYMMRYSGHQKDPSMSGWIYRSLLVLGQRTHLGNGKATSVTWVIFSDYEISEDLGRDCKVEKMGTEAPTEDFSGTYYRSKSNAVAVDKVHEKRGAGFGRWFWAGSCTMQMRMGAWRSISSSCQGLVPSGTTANSKAGVSVARHRLFSSSYYVATETKSRHVALNQIGNGCNSLRNHWESWNYFSCA